MNFVLGIQPFRGLEAQWNLEPYVVSTKASERVDGY